MKLNEYQEKAMTTCLPTCNNFGYMFLNLMGEVGEFASKVAKAIRKGEQGIYGSELYTLEKGRESRDELFEALQLEAGDILWQLSGLCSALGWSLEDVAQANLDKLAARKVAGTIDGNGDGIIREK